jgi:cytochrome c oxidase subunit 2
MMRRAIILIATSICLGGCEHRLSILNPAGPQAQELADLTNLFLVVCTVVWTLVMIALAAAMMRRREDINPNPAAIESKADESATKIVLTAVAISFLIIVGLSLRSFYSSRVLAQVGEPALTIELTGNQWWWDVRYQNPDPQKILVTANEVHIPTGTVVTFKLRANDVIHSFWVPQLTGKEDLIPGHTNYLTFLASEPGVYTGPCAEFCGLQHAYMTLSVVAEEPEQFNDWYSAQLQPAKAPESDDASRGQHVFLRKGCPTCHTVQGTPAAGRRGPDLTHFGSARTIGAGVLPNTPENLASWIKDPQRLKPGVNMPIIELSDTELREVTAYVAGLK